MTQYAYFDSTKPAPQNVIGWYDTGVLNYETLPSPNDLLELTPEQWRAHFANPSGWAVINDKLIASGPSASIVNT